MLSIFFFQLSLTCGLYLSGCLIDDIIIMGNDHLVIAKVKQHLFKHFQTKDLNKLKYLLGIKVE